MICHYNYLLSWNYYIYVYIYGYRVLKMGGPQNHSSLVSLLSMRHPLVLGYQCNIVWYHIISTFVVLLCPTNIRLQYIYIYAVHILLYYIHIMCIYYIMVYMFVIHVYVYILYTIPIYYGMLSLYIAVGCLALAHRLPRLQCQQRRGRHRLQLKRGSRGGVGRCEFSTEKTMKLYWVHEFLWISMILSDFDRFC